MKKILHSIPVLFLIGSALFFGCKASEKGKHKDYINYDWANNPLWDDGQAEVAIYDATKEIYGKSRSFEYAYILVKEEFNESYHVKTDDYERDDLYPVMKINKFCRIETQKYPYHFLTSVFIHRGNPEDLHKLTHTSQEWCGNTSKHFLEQGGKYQFDYMSYFDGEGNDRTKISKGPWFEDQLSYTLRTLKFRDGLLFDVDIYPSQISNSVERPRAVSAHAEVSKADSSDLADIDQSFIDSPWKVVVTKASEGEITFWINGSYPNYLLKMESSDGRSLQLKELKRDKYWAYE